MKFLDSLSYRKQIFIGFLVVALIPLLLSMCFSTYFYSVVFQHELETDGNRQIVELNERLTGFFDSSEQICKLLCEEELSAKALIDKVNDEYQKALYLTLYQNSATIPTDVLVSIYDIGGHLRFATSTQDAEEILPIYWGILGEAKRGKNQNYYITNSIANRNSNVLLQTVYTVENQKKVRMGYITMSLTKADFDQLFNGFFSQSDTIFVTDRQMNIIYCSSQNYGQSTIDMLQENEVPNNFWYSGAVEPTSGYHVILQKQSLISTAAKQGMFRISLFISFICLILCVIVSMILGKQLSNPIDKLNKAMELVKKGNLSIHVHTNQQNELGELTNNFNHMTEELSNHVDNMVRRQKDIQDMQIQLFQTQLNPHFLYNTLDSIKWSARIHHLEDISLMAENLAYILQNSIRKEQFIPLQGELDIIDNYIKIQQIRFNGKFTYEVEIPDDLVDCIVPKLMLQPIVENSIIHGLAEQEGGSISIYADQIGDTISINVTDDGVGMSQEIIDWLNTDNFMENEGHLGLYNVNKIIKLYFGRQYGITATVKAGIGTTVTIVLPIRKEKMP